MNKNPFNHIDLRVTDIKSALAFYSKFLPALGFTNYYCDDEGSHIFGVTSGDTPLPFFALNEARNHKPNANRIAFGVSTKEEVDRIAQVIKEAGAKNIEGPCECREYTPSYYAVFFEDPCGNKLEVCYNED